MSRHIMIGKTERGRSRWSLSGAKHCLIHLPHCRGRVPLCRICGNISDLVMVECTMTSTLALIRSVSDRHRTSVTPVSDKSESSVMGRMAEAQRRLLEVSRDVTHPPLRTTLDQADLNPIHIGRLFWTEGI